MYKLLSLSIFLSFFVIQSASALTLKKGETLGSDGQINAGTASKSAEASDKDETVIYWHGLTRTSTSLRLSSKPLTH